MSPKRFVGANKADRAPTATSASPRAILRHSEALWTGVRRLWRTATLLPRRSLNRNTVWGVIIASRSEARNGPSPEFQVGFVIPEGREVRVLGREGDWVAVGLTSEGYKGWIKREDLAEDE